MFFIKVVFCPSKLYQNMKKPLLRLQLSGRKDKWVQVCLLVTQSYLNVCNPMDYSSPGSSIHGILSRQESWSEVSFPSPGNLPDPGIKSRFPEVQIVSFYLLSHPYIDLYTLIRKSSTFMLIPLNT